MFHRLEVAVWIRTFCVSLMYLSHLFISQSILFFELFSINSILTLLMVELVFFFFSPRIIMGFQDFWGSLSGVFETGEMLSWFFFFPPLDMNVLCFSDLWNLSKLHKNSRYMLQMFKILPILRISPTLDCTRLHYHMF